MQKGLFSCIIPEVLCLYVLYLVCTIKHSHPFERGEEDQGERDMVQNARDMQWPENGHGKINDKEGRQWWKKVVDVEEGKNQILFAVPLILTNGAFFFIPLISVMFAGHFGDIELAASNLANSWSNVTGFMFMIGLGGSLETLCGQAFGAQLYGLLGVYLQSSCYISIFFSILISILWLFTEPILILFHQDPNISKMTALYMKYLIPGLFAYGLMNSIFRFLQMQSVVIPLVFCSVLPLIMHVGITYNLVHYTSLGFVGAPLATSISYSIAFIMLAVYVLHAKKCKETWKGFSLESFCHVLPNLKLALPSAAMFLFEYLAFEVMVLLAGLLPNSEITTPLIAICTNTESAAYMVVYGLSAAVSTRVSNELGAGNPDKAKHAFKVTLKLSMLIGLVTVLALGFGHNIWARLFSDNPVIISEFASMIPFILVGTSMDTIQGVVTGVVRGCGWQHVAVYINLGVYYLIALPTAVILAFKFKLHAKGLYIGLMCGLFCQSSSLLLLTQFKKWKRVDLPGNNDVETALVV